MKVTVSRTKIKKRDENRVTGHLILEAHRRQKPGDLHYDDEGPFSKRIFGNLYKCDCGQTNFNNFEGDGPIICPACGCRVVHPANMPDFYMDLGTYVSVHMADYDDAHRYHDDGAASEVSRAGKWNRGIKANVEQLQAVAEYRSFVYESEDPKTGKKTLTVVENTDDIAPDEYDNAFVFIGREGLLKLGVDESWVNENMVDFLLIPHPIYRPMVISGGAPFITPINQLYSNILYRINLATDMREMAKDRPLYLMSLYHVISDLYHQILQSLFTELQDAEYSVLKSEIISHPVSGAVRATVINRHDVHEDVIIIGDTLVETLYPWIYQKHNGDMEAINEELVEGEYLLLVNRPPTINHNSTMAMYPRIASIYPMGHTGGTDMCMKHNVKWCEERRSKMKRMDENDPNYGDVERYGQGLEIDPETGKPDGIDTIGLRCVGLNLLMADTMNLDTDGDVILEVALYSKAALEEAKTITPSRSFLNYANGTIRNHIIEDFIHADQTKQSADR